MRKLFVTFLIGALVMITSSGPVFADQKPVSIAVLKFGTVSWLIDTIQHYGFDKKQGITLKITPLASNQATTVGLQAGAVDVIASDWLWVSRERAGGSDLTFSPFSTALGAIVVPPNSPIKTLKDLKGKTIGVAGSPIDKSWLLIVAYALRTANIDLRKETHQVFGAPPLLSAKAEQGQLDAVLNFWPYTARLEAKGFTDLIDMNDVIKELGARGDVAMVGFVFSEAWAKGNPEAIVGFLKAAHDADELLATSDAAWDRLKPLMQAGDEKTFEALRRRYREGIPERSVAENEADAKVLYAFLRDLGGPALVGPGKTISPGTFWTGSGS